jgi:hypothetical protein
MLLYLFVCVPLYGGTRWLVNSPNTDFAYSQTEAVHNYPFPAKSGHDTDRDTKDPNGRGNCGLDNRIRIDTINGSHYKERGGAVQGVLERFCD